MKKLCLTIAIAVFLLICLNGIQAQTVTTTLDQLKLGQQFLGTWQTVISKDTIEVTESQQYGNAFIEIVYLVINGKKSYNYINSFCLSSKEGIYKGFVAWANGNYFTWIGSFVTEKKFSVNFVQNFNPEIAYGRMEIEFETPTLIKLITFNSEGIKTAENKSSKVN